MISKDDLEKKFNQEYDNLQKEITKPNIFVIGATGVGKSTLINTIFGEEVAKTSDSKPETRGVNQFTHKNVVLFDTEGLELDERNEQKFDKEILGEISRRSNGDIKDKIHLLWYLLPASSDRVTDYQIGIFQKLKEFKIPVAVVFTKSDSATEEGADAMIKRLYSSLDFNKSFNDKNNPPFFVSNNEDEELSPIHLINWSIDQLPTILKYAFVSSQILNYEAKYKEGRNIVLQHTGGNALVGFTPIPFSDAPILIASQIGMLARIINLYQLDGFDLKTFMGSTGTGLIISNLGKSAVGSLLKFIPIVGTAIGGIINAGVAGAITFAMGMSLNVILNKLFIDVVNGNKEGLKNVINNFESIFSAEFSDQFKSKRDE